MFLPYQQRRTIMCIDGKTRKMVAKKTILKAIMGIRGVRRQPEIHLAWHKYNMLFAECPGFRLRLRKEGDWILEIAVKKSFDRWANSVNFVQKVPAEILHPIAIDFNKALNQARKVVRVKAFDWDSYFDPIFLNAGWRPL